MVDGLAGLTPGELVGATIEIVGGAGAGQKRTVIANTATSITVGRPWDIAPAAGSAYEVRRYDGLVVRSVAVTIEDNDIAGVAIVVTGTDTRVTEGAPAGHPGAADTYEVVLTRQPDADVIVTITTDGQTEARRFGVGVFGTSLVLTFTPDTWNVAQVVEVRAFADTLIEGARIQVISHTVSSDPAVESDDTASRTDTIVEPDAVSTILLSERPVPGSAVTVTAEDSSSNQIQRVVVGSGARRRQLLLDLRRRAHAAHPLRRLRGRRRGRCSKRWRRSATSPSCDWRSPGSCSSSCSPPRRAA